MIFSYKTCIANKKSAHIDKNTSMFFICHICCHDTMQPTSQTSPHFAKKDERWTKRVKVSNSVE